MLDRRHFVSAAIAAPLAAALRCARAVDGYPSKTVRLVVPFPPGGTFDGLARLFAEKLSAAFRQTVLVDNRPGAATMVGAAFAAKAPGDGYTVLLASSGIAQNPGLYAKMPYDASELTPVAKLHDIPFALAVHSGTGINSIQDFIARAKALKGSLSVGTISTTAVALTAILANATGIEVIQTPYKGEAPATTDLLGGQIHALFLSPGSAAQHEGKLKILAVTGTSRVARLPSVPTFQEVGIGALNQSGWGGVFVPSTTPRSIIDMLSAESTRIGTSPELVERTHAAGYAVHVLAAREFSQFFSAEQEYWARTFRQFGIKAE